MVVLPIIPSKHTQFCRACLGAAEQQNFALHASQNVVGESDSFWGDVKGDEGDEGDYNVEVKDPIFDWGITKTIFKTFHRNRATNSARKRERRRRRTAVTKSHQIYKPKQQEYNQYANVSRCV